MHFQLSTLFNTKLLFLLVYFSLKRWPFSCYVRSQPVRCRLADSSLSSQLLPPPLLLRRSAPVSPPPPACRAVQWGRLRTVWAGRETRERFWIARERAAAAREQASRQWWETGLVPTGSTAAERSDVSRPATKAPPLCVIRSPPLSLPVGLVVEQ